MANTSSKPSFALSYGFVGGPAHGQKLRKLATQAGFVPTSLDKADIIIAHSAGCWLIPTSVQPKLVIYVGMPLAMARAPRTWIRANLESFKEGNVMQNFSLRLKNTHYGLRQPLRNLGIIREANTKIGNPVIIASTSAIFIANHDDPWPRSEEHQQALMNTQAWAFIGMPGDHNNIWYQPERYVAIMEHYATLLA
ncbi:MAG TPA: hypothetical protein VF401_01560 [Candidatus Saccharimonadales bacterium]